VLQLLRIHSYGEDANVAVRQIYPIAHATQQDSGDGSDSSSSGPLTSPQAMRAWLKVPVHIHVYVIYSLLYVLMV
jgi:hypothetical protein